MPTPNKGPRMGGSPAHERLMLANLCTQLFEHGRITTTESKAKRLRPHAEKLITFGKRGDLHARRQVLKVIRDKSVVHELFVEIGPRYANRPGGYTRIVKIGPRKGDNAPMAIIELVEARTVAQTAVGEAERARGTTSAPRKAPTAATSEAAAGISGVSGTAAGVAAEGGATTEPATTEPATTEPEPDGTATGPATTTDATSTDATTADATSTDATTTDATTADAEAQDAAEENVTVEPVEPIVEPASEAVGPGTDDPVAPITPDASTTETDTPPAEQAADEVLEAKDTEQK